MNRYSELKAFVTVVDLGSFSAASKQLGTTKSSVSKGVSDLESRLSTKLLNRTTRKLSVTELGKLYYEKTKKIISDLDDADSAILQGNVTLKGTLNITASITFGLHHLKPVLTKYMQENEGISLNVDLTERRVNIVEEGIDLAIRVGVLSDSNLMARRLTPIKRQLYASKDYLEKYGYPQKPEDLLNHQMLNHVSVGKHLNFLDNDGNAHTVQAPVKLSINNADFILEAVIAGMGLAILPTYLTYKTPPEMKVVPVMQDYHLLDYSLYAIYPQTKYLPSKVRKLIDLLSEEFGDKPYWDE